MRGFTVIETLIVVGLIALLASVAIPGISTGLKHYRADAALDTVVGQLRLARSMAVDQRRVFSVSFDAGSRSVTLTRVDDDTEISSIAIGSHLSFAFGSGVAISGNNAPDRVSADTPIDLMNQTEVHFRPDGSAVTSGGALCNGVVHMAVIQDPTVARAVSVFGATGKIKGWRWVRSSSSGQWQ